MCGTTDIDAVCDGMDEQTFQRWQAADAVGMLNHTDRMLGLIAFLLASYMEVKMGRPNELQELTMPWVPQAEAASAQDLVRELRTKLGQD
jgi:hypothetical protein